MIFFRSCIIIFVFVLPLYSFSQHVSNIHFEQVDKQIHIYYDLEGDETYIVEVFCSTDNGNKWEGPLRHVTGAVGEDQKAGKEKVVVWNVLAERERLSGEILFKTKVRSGKNITFTDTRDGQTYKWVKIGRQIWMAENLNHKTPDSWWFKKKSENGDKYGRLYTWKVAQTACPSGWHLPTDDEWKELEMHLGMNQNKADDLEWRGTEGEKLKSTSGWNTNGGGTDAFGFSALPGGYRTDERGLFIRLDKDGSWWSATGYNSTSAWARALTYDTDQVYRSYFQKAHGFSIRCIRD